MPKPPSAARVALLALALAAPAQAGAAETFDFSISGIPIGKLSLAIEQTGEEYAATTRIDTAGIVGIFADFYFDGQSSGHMSPEGKVVPELFVATSKSPRALRHSRIEWEDGTPVMVSVEPPRSSAPDPAAQTGALDPVSASVQLLRDAPADQICATTIDIFDGSRKSRLKVAEPVEKDGRLVCDGTFSRIEGEAHSMAERPEFPFSLVFVPNGDGMARLQQIEAPTNFGQAVIARSD